MTENSFKDLNIENRIFTIRGVAVMLDSDIAKIYQVETRALNQAVKRNAHRSQLKPTANDDSGHNM